MAVEHPDAAAPKFDQGDIVYLVYLLLPFRAFLLFGRMLGWVAMLVRPRARRSVHANFRVAFGQEKTPAEINRLTRLAFEFLHTRLVLVQVAPLLVASGKVAKYFPIEGLDILDRALARGKGAIILGSHVNSLGLLLAAAELRRRGYEVRVPVPEERDAWAPTPFRRFVNRRFGAPRSTSEAIGSFYAQFNLRPLVKLLNSGTVLVMIGDGWHSAGFVDVEFLGRRLPFTNGPLSVAWAAGAPVVPTFSVGTPDHLRFVMEEAYLLDRTRPSRDEIAQKVEQFIGRVEQRMLADIPSWQHWFEDDLFGNLEQWRTTSLRERYTM